MYHMGAPIHKQCDDEAKSKHRLLGWTEEAREAYLASSTGCKTVTTVFKADDHGNQFFRTDAKLRGTGVRGRGSARYGTVVRG
jgi:hypothetical protein